MRKRKKSRWSGGNHAYLIDRFKKVDGSSGWVGFLHYKNLLFWEGFEMYRIKRNIPKKKVYRDQSEYTLYIYVILVKCILHPIVHQAFCISKL